MSASITTGKQLLLPYDRMRHHLIETGWQGIAGWNRDAKMSKQQRAESVLDLYAKNGRVILLGATQGGGFEIWFPSPTMQTEDVFREVDMFGAGGYDALVAAWQVKVKRNA